MKSRNRITSRLVNPTIVGQGAYGCVVRPSLRCDKTGVDYSGKVSKLMTSKEADKEHGEVNRLIKHPNMERYILHVTDTCVPSQNNVLEKVVSACNADSVKQEFKQNPRGLQMLLFEDGGVNLHDFATSMVKGTGVNVSKMDLHVFLTAILHLIDGLNVFKKNGVIHQDIKLPNMVYNVTTGKIRFIDFGLSTDRKRFILESSETRNDLAQTWEYFPPEYSCANRESFNGPRCRGKLMRLMGISNMGYDEFINQVADTFDAYSFSLAMKGMFGSFSRSSVGKTIPMGFWKDCDSMFDEYSESNLRTRSKRLDNMYSMYENTLKQYNVFLDKLPSPSPQVVRKAQSLSVHSTARNSARSGTRRAARRSGRSTGRSAVRRHHSARQTNINLKSCPSNKIRNPASNRCVKRCADARQQRDKNFRCITRKRSPSSSPHKRATRRRR